MNILVITGVNLKCVNVEWGFVVVTTESAKSLRVPV